MNDTKELILLTALRLFAKDGYEAVSVSMIASELGMVKSALYKHYKSKQDILDSIILRMAEMDNEKAVQNDMPENTYEENPENYQNIHINDIQTFTKEMFLHWTEDEFAALFRKMLTIEQYRNPEMSALYAQYLSRGPLGYVEDLFENLTGDHEHAGMLALRFYAPMYMLYNLYDAAADKAYVQTMLSAHIAQFIAEIKETYKLN